VSENPKLRAFYEAGSSYAEIFDALAARLVSPHRRSVVARIARLTAIKGSDRVVAGEP
jgi:hypothetical protein